VQDLDPVPIAKLVLLVAFVPGAATAVAADAAATSAYPDASKALASAVAALFSASAARALASVVNVDIAATQASAFTVNTAGESFILFGAEGRAVIVSAMVFLLYVRPSICSEQ